MAMNNKDQSIMLHQSHFELGGDYKQQLQQLQSELIMMAMKENLNKIQIRMKTKN